MLVLAPVSVWAANVKCTLGRLAELPVTMRGLQPIVPAKINGADAPFVVDSGAFYSVISPAGAAELKLHTYSLPFHLDLVGIGGRAEAYATRVKDFNLAGIPISNVEFIVAGSDVTGNAVGVLGQNVLRVADVEYDLANGVIRLMRPHDCGKADLAYWAGSKPYSALEIDWATAASPHTTGVAFINGAKIRVLFDTGASTSILSLRAAERAGIKPDSPGVVAGGFTVGIGSREVPTWVGPFASFKIGDEEIQNTRLRFGDIRLTEDMLIGADFFLSHRIYVASSQRKLYFTYNGGPVFNLKTSPAHPAKTAQTAGDGAPSGEPGATSEDGSANTTTSSGTGPQSTSGPTQAGSTQPAPTPATSTHAPGAVNEPTDAAGFGRRGAAYAARRDLEPALADLTRACELAPTEPQYFFQRGLVRVSMRQPTLALSDFDTALKLKPDDVGALIARAELRLDAKDDQNAIGDLDAADRAAPKEAAVRLPLGRLYQRAGLPQQAIAQYNLWIAAHRNDGRMVEALHARCWSRALAGSDLDGAMDDCNRALRARPNPHVQQSRGLVRLRKGDFDKSIADFNSVLQQEPRNAWALYVRGLAELRKGLQSEGQADLAAAKALQPRIADDLAKYGLTPE
jgi:tetratricopeptide (TPR) repeat protein/predicted aspartyl protease